MSRVLILAASVLSAISPGSVRAGDCISGGVGDDSGSTVFGAVVAGDGGSLRVPATGQMMRERAVELVGLGERGGP